MSFPTRSLSTHRRGTSASASGAAQSPALVARIEEKKAELEHLKGLRDLSGAVATQMEALQQRLSTLSDGTEAIATVMGNWHNVLRAINMASAKLATQPGVAAPGVAAPGEEDQDQNQDQDQAPTLSLPQTLVRIPTEHAPTLQAQAEAAEDAAPPST